MCLLAWCRGDPLPTLPALDRMRVEPKPDIAHLAALVRVSEHELVRRLEADHQPYVALMDGRHIAYGWVARQLAHVGELAQTIRLPETDRYLWDFQTLPAWRGHGVYPRLLQAMIMAEQASGCFWIIHAPENTASGRGMLKAGFQPVGRLSFVQSGRVGFAAFSVTPRARSAAALLDVPITEEQSLSMCWHCVLGPEGRCSCAVRGRCVCTTTAKT